MRKKRKFPDRVAESENFAADYPYASLRAHDTIIIDSVYPKRHRWYQRKGVPAVLLPLRVVCIPGNYR